MEAVNEPVMLMEIERELSGPQKEAALAKYDAIQSAMRVGLSPDEFPKVEKLKEANILARKILRLTVRVDGGRGKRSRKATFNNKQKKE